MAYKAGDVDAAEKPRSGSRYAAFNTTISGGGIYQDIPASINAGDTFCASTFVRAQKGGTASGSFALWLIGGASNENGVQAYGNLATLDKWTPLSTCVTATTGHSAIRVQFYPTPNGGTTDADDVSITNNPVTSSRPWNISRPTIGGSARRGHLLTVRTGRWTPSVLRLRYRWLRDGQVIQGASRASYRLVRADVGHRISVRATVNLPGYYPSVAISSHNLSCSQLTTAAAQRCQEMQPRVDTSGLRLGDSVIEACGFLV